VCRDLAKPLEIVLFLHWTRRLSAWLTHHVHLALPELHLSAVEWWCRDGAGKGTGARSHEALVESMGAALDAINTQNAHAAPLGPAEEVRQ
jgi:hypothetical protein